MTYGGELVIRNDHPENIVVKGLSKEGLRIRDNFKNIEIGNKFFEREQFAGAIKCYSKALQTIDDDNDLKLTVIANMA